VETDDDADAGEAHIGASVARYRVARGLSQAQLAQAIGVHQQTIAKIEKGTRPLRFSEATSIAGVLQVNVSVFNERPERAQAEAEAIRVKHQVTSIRRSLTNTATEVAHGLVCAAVELAVDRARPPHHRIPGTLVTALETEIQLADGLQSSFGSELKVVVRRILEEQYEVQLPRITVDPDEHSPTIGEMLMMLADKPLEIDDAKA
jgi:transcriptional regulator with XRE-family HTH domain